MAVQQVFISYAWGGESELVADEIHALLTANTIRLIRDKSDLGFKGLIREFMEKIGQGNLVILIISDKYLKSKNCMFELLEVAKKGEFHNRIFPVVLTDADIYDSLGLITYLKYWDQKIKELNANVKELDNLADTRKVQEDINLYTDIRGAIDDLAGKISDMNTLTLEIMRAKKYQPLLDALGEKPGAAEPAANVSKKEGKVLYHIPGMMQINTWTRCIVRLAWEEILLLENLPIPKEELTIESIRLAKTMQVSLVESRKGANFEIASISNEEQFIDEGDFTEWLYDVKPLNQGSFTLILRITLIHTIEGREKKKDIVLEREVITETTVPKALQKFETASRGLTPPEAEGRDPGPTKPGEMIRPEESYPRVYPELNDALAERGGGPVSPSPYPKNMGSPAPGYSGSNRIPSETPMFPFDRPIPVPPKKLSNKWLVPTAASVVGMLMVSLLVFSNLDSDSASSSADPDLGAIPSQETGGLPGTYQPNLDDKMLLTLTLDATGPNGEPVYDVMIFIVEKSQLQSLSSGDFEGYVADTSSISDEMALSLGAVTNLTLQEIKDTLGIVSKKPIRVGNQMIDRKNLKTHSTN